MRIGESFNSWWMDQGGYLRYDAIFFDIDGTLLDGDRRAIPGACTLLEWLRDRKFPFKLITNDGNHSLLEKSDFLNKAGLSVEAREIVSCSLALKDLVREHSLSGKRLFVMGDLGRPVSYAELAGVEPVCDPGQIDSCEGIVIGEGSYDWRNIIQKVFNYLLARRGSGLLIVPNPDSYWPDGHGGLGIGAGGIGRFIQGLLRELLIPQELHYLGKPHRAVFDYALRDIVHEFALPGIPAPERLLMLGDFLPSDIRGANAFGMTSCLMLTGVTRPDQLIGVAPEENPDLVFRRLAALPRG